MTIPKYLKNKDEKKRSRRQEKKLAKKLRGRVQANSGAFWTGKGDVKSPIFLGEAKRTSKKSIRLREEWLRKLREEAVKEDKVPILELEIKGKSYFILAAEDFIELIESLL